MLDASGSWSECLDMWSPTPSTCRVTRVKPSGCLPSFRDRYDGSSLPGISAAVSARFMRSLTALCREWRPADRRHDRPWTPYWSTFSPHDVECKLAHQDVSMSRCGMTNCRCAFLQTNMGLHSKISRMRWCNRRESGLADCKLCSRHHVIKFQLH